MSARSRSLQILIISTKGEGKGEGSFIYLIIRVRARQTRDEYTMPIMTDIDFKIGSPSRKGTSALTSGGFEIEIGDGPIVGPPSRSLAGGGVSSFFNSRSPACRFRDAVTIPARFVPVSQTSFSQRATRPVLSPPPSLPTRSLLFPTFSRTSTADNY